MLLGYNVGALAREDDDANSAEAVDFLATNRRIQSVGELEKAKIVFPEYGPGRALLGFLLGDHKWPDEWRGVASHEEAVHEFLHVNGIDGAVLWGAARPSSAGPSFGELGANTVSYPEFLVTREENLHGRSYQQLQRLVNNWLECHCDPRKRDLTALYKIPAVDYKEGSAEHIDAAAEALKNFEPATLQDNRTLFESIGREQDASDAYIDAQRQFNNARDLFSRLQILGTSGILFDNALDSNLVPPPSPQQCDEKDGSKDWCPRVLFSPNKAEPNAISTTAFDYELDHYLRSHAGGTQYCIAGYADHTGRTDTNKNLSDQRAAWIEKEVKKRHPGLKYAAPSILGDPRLNDPNPDLNRKAVFFRARVK
jgi:hypothetical protein